MRGLKTSGVCALGALMMMLTGCAPDRATCHYENGELVCDSLSSGEPQAEAPVQSVFAMERSIAAWTSGSAMAVTQAEIIVADEDNGTVVVLDRQSGQVLRSIEVGQCPSQLVVGPDGDIWVTLRRTGQVAHIAPGAQEVSNLNTVGIEPVGLALSPQADALVVALWGENAVVSLDPATLQLRDALPVAGRPRAVAINQAGVVSVAGDLGTRSRLSLKDGALEELDARFLAGFTVIRSAQGAPRPGMVLGTAIHPERDEPIFTHQLVQSSVSVETEVIQGYYGPPREVVTVVDVASPTPVVTAEPLDPNQDVDLGSPKTFGDSMLKMSLPRDIAHHPSLTLAAVAGMASDTVAIVGTDKTSIKHILTVDVGQAPSAVAFSPSGDRLYVMNAHEHSVSEIVLFGAGQLPRSVIAERGGDWEESLRLQVSGAAMVYGSSPLSLEAQQGRRLFTHVRGIGEPGVNPLGCQSCHFEGGDDGMVRAGGEGLRQTPSLAGRLLNTAPFAWDGSSAALTDHIESTVERLGHAQLSARDLSLVASFLSEGLPEPVRPVMMEGNEEQIERGRLVFADPEVGCAACHSGPMTTDGQSHNIGTRSLFEQRLDEMRLEGGFVKELPNGRFNTPSLRNLRYTAPYLHDGSAPTLEDLLEMTDGKMGKTSHLTLSQRDDLLAYLRSL